ncbi:hypothetical protein [Nocardioides sp. Soil796]|uniref:hypothetical protein n=1 Tax=Nocardioides sp. Soil796 TaxID=1736412 RepID=UPI000708C308|nr:hypothetical protein [Nocardioides sp. Soil796]KRF10916.1 hypothetical protein ASH02_18925 [Nocardioides sp. Soil796]
MTTANLRTIDQQRAGRLLLGWLRSDKLAIDAAVNDAATDPHGGTPGILFAMTTLAAELTNLVAPDDAEQQIERALMRIAQDHPEGGGTA